MQDFIRSWFRRTSRGHKVIWRHLLGGGKPLVRTDRFPLAPELILDDGHPRLAGAAASAEGEGPALELVPLLDAALAGWFRKESGELLTGFKIGPQDTVIDIGSGEGTFSTFAGNCGAEVIAIDIDPDKIDLVKKKMPGTAARSFQTIVSDCNPLPLPGGVGTRILAQDVLEHVDDPAAIMAELVRVGKPGAQYLISVPDPASERLLQMVAPPACWRKPNHIRTFEREDLDGLVQRAGLAIEGRSSHSFFWSLWWLFLWASRDGNPSAGPEVPVLQHWTKTWHALITSPGGMKVKKALDDFLPKSQVVIARKAA